MKKLILNVLFILFALFIQQNSVHAYQFDLLVLPTNIFSECDNYFCFPEASNIFADDVIKKLSLHQNINVRTLAQAREQFEQSPNLKAKAQNALYQYAQSEKIDFPALKEISDAFGVKSILLITSYVTNDKVQTRRNIWDILEVTSAFKTSYPFEMKTSAVLTDSVNNIVMWSGKYNRRISDSNDNFLALSQTQAMSQLEKIKQYSKDNIAQTISQNVFMRFFPKDVRTFEISSKYSKSEAETPKKFIPNALDHLSDPRTQKEYQKNHLNNEFKYTLDDFSFEF